MTQQLVLEPLGLMTEPNKLGQIPAGALSSMVNAVERSPGVIENMRSWQTISSSTVASDAMFIVVPPGNQYLLFFNNTSVGTGPSGWVYEWHSFDTGAVTWARGDLNFRVGNFDYGQSIPITTQPSLTYQVIGNQLFVNFFSCVLVWDNYAPTTLAESIPRPASLQPPGMTVGPVSGSAGTAIEKNAWCAYTLIIKRTIGDKIVVSAPGAAYPFANPNPTPINTILTLWLSGGLYLPGDVVEIYRTKGKPAGLSAVFLNYQAGEEVGSEYLRATSYTLKAADITAGNISFNDTTPDSSLGEALYTNQAIGGAGASADPAPAVEGLVSYRGHLFGFAPTYPPILKLRPTGFWGGFDSGLAMSAAQMLGGLGSTPLTGLTYTSGNGTITISPSSQTALLSPGQDVLGTGLNGIINSVGSSTFTVIPAPTSTVSGGTGNAVDMLFATRVGQSDLYFADDWETFLLTIRNDTSLYPIAQSLSLPPYTLSVFGFAAQPTGGFFLRQRYLDDARSVMQLRSSKTISWDPQLAGYLQTPTSVAPEYKKSAFVWSEQNQPEAWPTINFDAFSRGQFNAAASTRDAMVTFWTDGVWRVSGTGGSAGAGYDWRADPLASGITLNGSQTIATLLDKVYAHTSEGLVVLDDQTGLNPITRGRVHDQLATPPWNDGAYTLTTAAFMVPDEANGEILLREPSAANGNIWIYNTRTDRLSQTSSHDYRPFHGGYSRYLKAPVIVGKDSSSGFVWTVKAPTGAYGNMSLTFQPVYADNPFALRQWQVLNVSAETAGATVQPTFNSTAGSTRTLDADGRAGFEVPRDSPATGNVMQVKLDVTTSNRTKLWGFALDYRDHTDRRKNR